MRVGRSLFISALLSSTGSVLVRCSRQTFRYGGTEIYGSLSQTHVFSLDPTSTDAVGEDELAEEDQDEEVQELSSLEDEGLNDASNEDDFMLPPKHKSKDYSNHVAKAVAEEADVPAQYDGNPTVSVDGDPTVSEDIAATKRRHSLTAGAGSQTASEGTARKTKHTSFGGKDRRGAHSDAHETASDGSAAASQLTPPPTKSPKSNGTSSKGAKTLLPSRLLTALRDNMPVVQDHSKDAATIHHKEHGSRGGKRHSKESAHKKAEKERVKAKAAKALAERVEAETARKIAETERAKAKAAKVLAERVKAETALKTAEIERAKAKAAQALADEQKENAAIARVKVQTEKDHGGKAGTPHGTVGGKPVAGKDSRNETSSGHQPKEIGSLKEGGGGHTPKQSGSQKAGGRNVTSGGRKRNDAGRDKNIGRNKGTQVKGNRRNGNSKRRPPAKGLNAKGRAKGKGRTKNRNKHNSRAAPKLARQGRGRQDSGGRTDSGKPKSTIRSGTSIVTNGKPQSRKRRTVEIDPEQRLLDDKRLLLDAEAQSLRKELQDIEAEKRTVSLGFRKSGGLFARKPDEDALAKEVVTLRQKKDEIDQRRLANLNGYFELAREWQTWFAARPESVKQDIAKANKERDEVALANKK